MSGPTNESLENVFKNLSDEEQEEEIRNLSTLVGELLVYRPEDQSDHDYRIRKFSLLLNYLPPDSSYPRDFYAKYTEHKTCFKRMAEDEMIVGMSATRTFDLENDSSSVMQAASNPPIQRHGNGESFHHVISIEEPQECIASMENKMTEVPKLLNMKAGNASCCIFRVPRSFVEINKKANEPHIVSIGPYHHGNEHLKMIEEHKWRYLGSILARTSDRGIGLNKLFNAIAPLEDKIRESYSENIEYDKNKFMELMILDGCFIIEVLCIVGRIVKPHHDDPIFSMSWMFSFLLRDFLKLENQIPFFVLKSLFRLIILPSTTTPSLKELALNFFDYAVQRPRAVLEKHKNVKGKHLLDLFRLTFIPQSHQNPPDEDDSQFLQLIHSARKLRLSGIKFKPRKAESFLDINFKSGTLEIPTLMMDDFLSDFLLNGTAFELCYKGCPKYITSYVVFMKSLINSPADAGYLQDHRIIENFYGNDEDVAMFFNDTGKDISINIRRSYLLQVFQDVNEYYKNPFHIEWAGFKHRYFDSPWSFMSAMAALILLLLTVIQAFYAAYPYINPSHKRNH